MLTRSESGRRRESSRRRSRPRRAVADRSQSPRVKCRRRLAYAAAVAGSRPPAAVPHAGGHRSGGRAPHPARSPVRRSWFVAWRQCTRAGKQELTACNTQSTAPRRTTRTHGSLPHGTSSSTLGGQSRHSAATKHGSHTDAQRELRRRLALLGQPQPGHTRVGGTRRQDRPGKGTILTARCGAYSAGSSCSRRRAGSKRSPTSLSRSGSVRMVQPSGRSFGSSNSSHLIGTDTGAPGAGRAE